MIQTSRHIIKGIQRDLSASKFNPEYAYGAQNIRLTAAGDNTLFSITNEKGPKDTNIPITGTLLGYCVINNYLTVFSKEKLDYITLITIGDTISSKILYEGDLNFDVNYPIETLGIFENENIQKVYWLDGKNQPRVINIVAKKTSYNSHSFDFVQTLSLKEKVTIKTAKVSNGSFASGVIQYAFSYYKKHLQESNIFYISPIQYISYTDRGASPEDKVNTSFSINIENCDNFDYVRVYSIHRSSINATPTVTKVVDLEITDNKVSYIDIGKDGEIIDTTALLYIGGESIIANTMTSKDNTLFLGDITLIKPAIKESITNLLTTTSLSQSTKEVNINKVKGLYYNYINPINTSTFKYGEHYRFGVQFQYKNGKWSEPIHIKDETILNKPLEKENTLLLPTIKYTVNKEATEALLKEGYIKARPVVVFPDFNSRKVVAQGILCPTVFRVGNRENGTPHNQSSWFLRPNNVIFDNNINNIDYGSSVEYRHLHSLFSKDNRSAEIQNILHSPDFADINNNVLLGDKSFIKDIFLVDKSIVTFHSPDIEFDDAFNTINDENYKLRIIGTVNFTANSGDIDIQTSSPTIHNEAEGFYHKSIANNVDGGRSLISGLFYKDYLVDDKNGEYEAFSKEKYEYSFLLYPWQKTGSINNDIKRPNSKGTRSSELKKKVISNLKFAGNNTYFTKEWYDNINPVTYFGGEEISLVKVPIADTTFNYYGNVDTLLSSSEKYSVIFTTGNNKDASTFYDNEFHTVNDYNAIGNVTETLRYSKEPVRMKYKSSPHLVFSLSSEKNNNYYTQTILPTTNTTLEVDDSVMKLKPFWLYNKKENLDGTEVEYLQEATPEIKLNKLWIKPIKDSFGEIEYYVLYKAVIEGISQETYTIKWKEQTINKEDLYYYEEESKEKTLFAAKETETGYVLTKQNIGHSDDYYIKQDSLAEYLPAGSPNNAYLFLAELYKDNIENPFGEKKNNTWLPAGEAVLLNGDTTIEYNNGDTWYQRYDCLKTYPYTAEDENQIIEIASFMCENRVNLEGRYDRNKGLVSNLNVSPANFNLLNKVYSQQDNYFTYKTLEKDFKELDDFHNTIIWSKQKTNSEDVDTWTNFSLLSTLDLDGNKGKVVSLNTFSNNIICFQETGISNILFNSRVQVPTSDGTNIEITNGLKVDGKRYITETLGCNNKWSIKETQSGIFFIDDKAKGIYSYSNEGVLNLSQTLGFNSWINNQNTSKWKVDFSRGFITHYDVKNKDIYFTNKETSLVFSETLKQFTSFMNYENVPAMFNVGNNFYSIKNGKLWKHFAGEYNYFYNEYKPFSVTYIVNSDEPYDKIFNTIEYRADFWDKKDTLTNNSFDKLEVWNEYQRGETNLIYTRHKSSTLKKKFRIWNAVIPRDKNSKRDRIRNTWAYIKLSREGKTTDRAVLHDVSVDYFI